MILDSLNLLWAALAAGLVRGMALFLFAAAITGLWKGLPSEARHLVWLSVIFSFLLLPLAWPSRRSRWGRGSRSRPARPSAWRLLPRSPETRMRGLSTQRSSTQP
jgi:hypothetical protein